MTSIHPKLADITEQVIKRSKTTRETYLEITQSFRPGSGVARAGLGAGNQAHAYAGCALHDKQALMGARWANIGIVTAYNDMLSAHAPYAGYPDIIKQAARDNGARRCVTGLRKAQTAWSCHCFRAM